MNYQINQYPHHFFGDIEFWINRIAGIQSYSNANLPFLASSGLSRTSIYTANGIQLLSIPLEGGRRIKLPYLQVRISIDNAWKNKHLHALQTAYGKSAFWEHYEDRIIHLYGLEIQSLIEFNKQTDLLVAGILKIPIPVKPMQIISPLTYPSYFQVFSSKFPFAPNISILDLLMNKGNKSLDYLQSFIQP